MRAKITGFFIALLLIYSCKKDAIDVDSNYVGEWHAESIVGDGLIFIEKFFVIDGNTAIFYEWCELFPVGTNCYKVYEGKAKINRKESKIEFGESSLNGPGRIILSINVPPHLNDEGKWECTLTQTVYTKI